MIFAVICAMVGAMFGWWGVLGVFIVGLVLYTIDITLTYEDTRRNRRK